MKPGETKTEVEEEGYFVVVVTLPGERPIPNSRKVEQFDRHLFFKADRYSPYSGRLQVEYDVSLARHWKTPGGAHGALKRLRERGTIKDRHNPVVCRYTKTITRSETLIAADHVPEESC